MYMATQSKIQTRTSIAHTIEVHRHGCGVDEKAMNNMNAACA